MLRKKLLGTYRSIRSDGYSYLCCAAGKLRVRRDFRRKGVDAIELGAGSRRKKGFFTSDMRLDADFPYDFRVGLPFPDQSLRLVYCEHVLEHFCFGDLQHLLREVHRTLKPGGTLSVVVPNAAIYVAAYENPDGFDRERYVQYQWDLKYLSPMDYLNYMFYMGGHHKYMFDEAALVGLLEATGFKAARAREFNPMLDQETRRHESLYAEAIK